MKPSLITRRIGRRIRKLRQIQGLSLEAAASKANISKSLLSKIENSKVSSPIATVSNIAVALGTTVGNLLGVEDGRGCVLVRRDERKPMARRGSPFGYTYDALGYKRLDKRMEPFIVTYPTGLKEVPSFSHSGEAFLFVLKGRLEFRHGGARFILSPGDCLYFDNELPHGGRALGRNGAVALIVTTGV